MEQGDHPLQNYDQKPQNDLRLIVASQRAPQIVHLDQKSQSNNIFQQYSFPANPERPQEQFSEMNTPIVNRQTIQFAGTTNVRAQPYDINVQKVVTPHRTTKCNCKKSKCKDNHCLCYRAGEGCSSQTCKCKGCLNQVSDWSRVVLFKLRRPCTCKKNSCKNNYCLCFKNGEKCVQSCRCAGCKNQEIRAHEKSRSRRKHRTANIDYPQNNQAFQ